MIGHRGASADFPENTRDAFEAALDAGADGIELDLQRTRDGVPLVFHDESLARLGRAGRVRDATWSELRATSATLLTLDDVLAAFASRTLLLLEIKAYERDRADGEHLRIAELVADRLAGRDASTRACVLSFDADCLDHVRACEPTIETVLNTEQPARWRADELAVHAALSVDVDRLTPDATRLANDASIPLMVYTVNDDAQLARAIDAEASFVMTDRPGWAVRRLLDHE